MAGRVINRRISSADAHRTEGYYTRHAAQSPPAVCTSRGLACKQLIFQISCGTGHACPRHASPGGKLTPARPVPASGMHKPQEYRQQARRWLPLFAGTMHRGAGQRCASCTMRQRVAAGRPNSERQPGSSWRCNTGTGSAWALHQGLRPRYPHSASSNASAHHHRRMATPPATRSGWQKRPKKARPRLTAT